MRPAPLLAPVLALLVLAADHAAAAPRVAPAPFDTTGLRARAAALFEKRERARTAGGVALEPLHRELRAMADTLERARLDSLAARAWYRAGGVVSRLARLAEAEADLRRSIAAAVRARAPRYELDARTLLADMLADRDPEQAIALLREVLARQQRLGDTSGVADTWTGLARAHGQLGRWPESFAASQRAVGLLARRGHPLRLAFALTQYGQNLAIAGRRQEALAIADSVVRMGRRTPLGVPFSRALVLRADVLGDLGRGAEALAALDEAIASDRAHGDASREASARLQRALQLVDLRRFAAALAETDTLTTLEGVRTSAVRGIRAADARALALAGLGRHAEADTLLAGALARFEGYRGAADEAEHRAGAARHAAGAWETWARVRLSLRGPAAAWRVLERARGRVLEEQLGTTDEPDLAALQRHLARTGAALIQLGGGGRNPLHAFVVTAESLHAVPLGPIDAIAEARAAVALLERPGGGSAARATLARLGRAVLDPPLAHVPPGTRRLLVVTGALLGPLPIEALPVAGRASLGEAFAVAGAPSATAALALERRAAAGGALTVFADPDLREAERGGAVPAAVLRSARGALPGAREEARRIARPGDTVLLGRDASADRLASVGAEAAVLHFATHAVSDPARPETSGLVLAGWDGFVTPPRIERLRLGADLVTLSGCRTAAGARYVAEGAFGLPRAFLVAGARSVVTTAWDVEDRAASRLMAAFYDALRAGHPRDESLRRARLAARAAGVPERDLLAFSLIGVGDAPVAALAGGGRGRGVAK